MCTIIPPKCQTWPIWNSQLDFGAKAMSHWNLSDYLILYLANSIKSNSRKIFSEEAIQVLMSFRLIYWIKWLCHGTCRYFMSQFFVTYTLLLIQSIGIFVLCSSGVILPLIFKPSWNYSPIYSLKSYYYHLFDSTRKLGRSYLGGTLRIRQITKIVKKERKKERKKKWNF